MDAEPDLKPLVLLAGGRSSRMGEPKGLLDYQGRPWILNQLDEFRRAGGTEVVVVLGFLHERYLEEVPLLEEALSSGVTRDGLVIHTVVNEHPEQGQFSSIGTGLTALGETDAFVHPVDIPCPAPEVWSALQNALTGEVRACIPVQAGRGGHPALISSGFRSRLIGVDPAAEDGRLDVQLHRLPEGAVAHVKVDDPRIHMDLNDPVAWRRWVEEGKIG